MEAISLTFKENATDSEMVEQVMTTYDGNQKVLGTFSVEMLPIDWQMKISEEGEVNFLISYQRPKIVRRR